MYGQQSQALSTHPAPFETGLKKTLRLNRDLKTSNKNMKSFDLRLVCWKHTHNWYRHPTERENQLQRLCHCGRGGWKG